MAANWKAFFSTVSFVKRQLATLFRRHPYATSGFASTTVYLGAYLFTCTEHGRMAKKIIAGKLLDFNTTTLNTNFCQVDLKKLESVVDREDLFVGIIGLKASGKTSALQLFSEHRANVMYIKMTLGEEKVRDRLYSTLIGSVWKLPTYLDYCVRSEKYSDPEYVVKEVFSRVQTKTGRPVTVLIDLAPPQDEDKKDNTTHDPKARAFVRQIKDLVSDRRIMRCIFASSEGGGFQIEQRREPRLELFITRELSMATAVAYLKEVQGTVGDDIPKLLLWFPRTFSNLSRFAACYKTGKAEVDLFVSDMFKKETTKVAKTLILPGAVAVYKTALEKGCCTVKDIMLAGFNEQSFVKSFVDNNIFVGPVHGDEYEFQFDSTVKAAEKELPIVQAAEKELPIVQAAEKKLPIVQAAEKK